MKECNLCFHLCNFLRDRDSVTLLGHGTGAAMVNLLLISPVAQASSGKHIFNYLIKNRLLFRPVRTLLLHFNTFKSVIIIDPFQIRKNF